MTSVQAGPRRAARPRIGLFGLFGSGNIGNDGSLEAMLAYIRATFPRAEVEVLCPGPKRVKAAFGVASVPVRWYIRHADGASGFGAIALKTVGKIADPFRIAAWVRRQDVIIVPGTGILEATLPLRPWGTPYELLSVCASGRLFRTKVALVSVGSNPVKQRLTRGVIAAAARLANYRTYRDAQSRDALRRCGVDTSRDRLYPDIAFALPEPSSASRDVATEGRTVGVGVMAYFGGNDDRRHASEMHLAYTDKMKTFVRWLVETGHPVRLFTGDDVDASVVQEIVADLEAHRPDLDPSWFVAEPVSSLTDLMRQMASVDMVVATRYHNVVCALKLGKPTVSIGYSGKNDALMADCGLSDFCQSARSLDIDKLIEQFTEMECRSGELVRAAAERRKQYAQRIDEQFSILSALIRPDGEVKGRARGAHRAGSEMSRTTL